MNKILILFLGILLVITPCSSQDKKPTNNTTEKPVTIKVPPIASGAGLGPLPTALSLLIPAAILGFIHSRS